MRVTFATGLETAGVSLNWMKELLGQENLNKVMPKIVDLKQSNITTNIERGLKNDRDTF